MTNLMKRGLALLLVLIVCLSSLPAICITASAADGYIYNWGKRGEVATSLSQNALDFYSDNNTSYSALAALSGSTSTSSVPSSALYQALKTLMVSAHKHQTSYSETKSLYKYTDCQNGGGAISSFYSGKSIGPSWDGSWNREHTWPNSKGLGGNDENDLMMLRPTSISENSSRGNTAYGKSSGYYNPNSESGGQYDLRGDVARIFLYVYVRWGNTSRAWGTSGVMESREVLLEWMQADPVDTWELGRNDSVESITGTRNVFVDYPELCFIMFGAQIPSNMATPSGGNSGSGGTVTPPSGGNQGGTTTPPAGGDQGDTTPTDEYTVVNTPVAGTAYKFAMVQQNVNNKVFYLAGGMAQTYYLATTDYADAAIDVYLEATTGGYYLYTIDGTTKKYINMVVSDTHVNGVYQTQASTVYRYDSANKTLVANIDVPADTSKSGDYWFGTRNDKSYETVGPCKTSYNGFVCQFYAKSEAVTPPAHQHTFIDGTCSCGEKDPTYVPPHTHVFVEGTCSCGEKDPTYVPPTPPAGGDQGGTTTPPAGGDQGGTTTPPAGGDQGGTTTPPAGGDQGGTTTPPAGGDQGGTTTPPAGGDQGSDTENGDCNHVFGNWEVIDSTGGSFRTCTKCGTLEFSSPETDNGEDNSNVIVIVTVVAVVALASISGAIFVIKRKRK